MISQIRKFTTSLIILLCVLCGSCVSTASAQVDTVIRTIGITTPVTISGNTVRVMQTGISNIKLKKLDLSVSVNGSEIGTTGFYQFNFTGVSNYPGLYRLYINDNIKLEYGITQIGIFPDIASVTTITGAYTFTVAPVYSGSITTNTQLINNNWLQGRLQQVLDSAASKGYMMLSGTQTVTGNKLFSGVTAFSGQASFTSSVVFTNAAPTTNHDPSTGNSLVRKSYMEDYVQALIAGEITAYQQSENIVRILYSGSQEDNRVYRTLSAGAANAGSFANSTRRYTVFVEGNGNTGEFLSNHNLFSQTDVYDYVDIQGINTTCIIEGADNSYEAVYGRSKISNVTIKWTGDASAPSFEIFIFENCIFDFADNSLTLDSCELQGVNIFRRASTGTLSMTDVHGAPYLTNIAPTETGTNTYYTLYSASAYKLSARTFSQPVTFESTVTPSSRVFGKKGADVSSASVITLGNGNYFLVKGTTTIGTITTTNWIEGSIVTLRFESALTITNLGGNIVTQTGSDLSVTTNKTYSFVFDENFWWRIVY